jgi:V8-like Glu-specific endopeptidase
VQLHVRFLTRPRRGQRAAFTLSPVRIGRSRDNDIVIPELPEPLSSGRHAEFVFEGGHWWIVDLGSTNGTRLNGVEVRRARLQDRDRVSLADHEIEVRIGPGRLAWPLIAGAAAALVLAAGAWGLWQSTRGPLDAISAAARRSVYLVVIQEGDRRTPVGTAFAVGGRRLVTNAHVAAPLAALPAGGARAAFAVSGDPGEPPRRVTGVTLHPEWKAGSIAGDVAVLDVEGPALTPLPLAGDDAIRALAPGDTVAIFGFPAAFTEPDRPHGSLAVNVLREVRGSRYLVVGIAVAPGSSGSPVFTTDGRVIGMVAGSGRTGSDAKEWEATSPGTAIAVPVIRELVPPSR